MGIKLDTALIRSKLAPLTERAQTYYRGLTTREQQILVGCGLVVIIAILGTAWTAVQEAFDSQSARITQVEMQLSKLGSEIEQYSKWKQRKDSIEERFRQVEIKEGVSSHLETLLRTKAEISRGFSIKDLGVKEFGKEYKQESYTVTFSTANLPALVTFLKELLYGARPVVLGRLDLDMPAHRSALDVRVEVAAIRKANDQST